MTNNYSETTSSMGSELVQLKLNIETSVRDSTHAEATKSAPTCRSRCLRLDKYFTVITYGCQMNEHDSEQLAGQLNCLGYKAAETLAKSDIIIINTCCVRESAEKKILGKIGELKGIKAQKPELIIGIAGCMAQRDQNKLLKKISHVDFVLGTNNIHNLESIVKQILQKREHVLAVADETELISTKVPVTMKSQISAWVPIMYGCNNFCTYCIVPYVRGRERSRTPDVIIRDIRELGDKGYKEITLLGQNVNSYGKELGNIDFANLLKSIDEIDTIKRIRYMTSHPRDMDEKVIETIRTSKRVCEHFHLPIQSGCDKILKQMNRGYTTEYYLKTLSNIRQAIPGASVTTDIIVGFPGETEAMFQETLDFVRAAKFDAAYTFIYSKRSGTPAAIMAEQVPLLEKKRRLQLLMHVQNDNSLANNKLLENRVLEVMVEGASKNSPAILTGRTRSNKIVLWKKSGNELPGQLVQVKVTSAQTWLLKGKKL